MGKGKEGDFENQLRHQKTYFFSADFSPAYTSTHIDNDLPSAAPRNAAIIGSLDLFLLYEETKRMRRDNFEILNE